MRRDFNMKQHYLLLWIILVVGGVFGDESVPVSVVEGDSVTLISNFAKQKSQGLKWYINNTTIIAKIDEDTHESSVSVNEGSLKSRLKLDETTGSLTITNISRDDTRDYKLRMTGQSKQNLQEPKIFKVIVKVGQTSILVMEGDDVTLPTDVPEVQKDQIQWTFGDQPCDNQNNQNGDLTLTGLKRSQSGIYKMKITTDSMILLRHFNVTVSDEESLTVTPGIHVPLFSSVTLNNNLVKLKFKDQDIPIDPLIWGSPDPNWSNIRFDNKAGNLTIRNISRNQSGLYEVEIINKMILHKKIHITFSETNSGVSPGAVAEIVVGLLVLHWCLQL